jgi:hypothetical protein
MGLAHAEATGRALLPTVDHVPVDIGLAPP